MYSIPVSKKLIAFGSKKIYLPKFTIALVRTRNLSPYHARFLVPLDFSKFDLRDYLYHAYNIKCWNVRSNVRQMAVRDTNAQPRHWFRPPSKKYMTVEMDEPFVWPEVPDMRPWGGESREKEINDMVKAAGVLSPNDERDQARRLQQRVAQLLQKEVTPEAIEKRLAEKEQKVTEIKWDQEKVEKERLKLKEKMEKEVADKAKSWAEYRPTKVARDANSEDYVIKV